jgi:hypothetical protein
MNGKKDRFGFITLGVQGLESLTQTAKFAVLVFLALIFFFLSWESLRYTCFNNAVNVDIVHLRKDSVWGNLLVFLLLLVFMGGVMFCFQKFSRAGNLAVKILLPIACLWVMGISLWWAFAAGTTTSGDQLIVSAAAVYAKEGDLIMMTKGGYLNIFPQQLGLVSLFELLFRIAGDYRYDVIYVIYALMNGICVYLGYSILDSFKADDSSKILYLLLMSSCLPYFIFTPFIYGDIPSICICMLMFWAAVKLETSGRYRYLILLSVAGALAVLVRKNSLIAVIGTAIGLVLLSLGKGKLKFALSALVLLVAVFLGVKSIETMYEVRSGYKVDGGIPASLYMAMGLQGDMTTPGRFNNYNKMTFYENDGDRDRAAQAGWDYIRDKMDEFNQSPSQGITFFKMKLLTQWNMPTFESLVSNRVFAKEPTGLIENIYIGSIREKIFHFLDRYQFVVYGGAFLGILTAFWKRPNTLGFYIPLIVILGGFLFSLMWEAKCRYVLPYFIFTIPYAAYGIANTTRLCSKTLASCISSINHHHYNQRKEGNVLR